MDKKYMEMALEIAEKGLGHVNPNPLVGAVVVKDGTVVGEECDVEHEHHYPNMPNPKGAIQPVKFR